VNTGSRSRVLQLETDFLQLSLRPSLIASFKRYLKAFLYNLELTVQCCSVYLLVIRFFFVPTDHFLCKRFHHYGIIIMTLYNAALWSHYFLKSIDKLISFYLVIANVQNSSFLWLQAV